LQILVDTFVTDRGQQGHIRHPNLFLLKPFFPVRLYPDQRLHSYEREVLTFATLAFAPAFFAAGVTFFPAFLDGAWQHVNRLSNGYTFTNHATPSGNLVRINGIVCYGLVQGSEIKRQRRRRRNSHESSSPNWSVTIIGNFRKTTAATTVSNEIILSKP
jgi:hypothetical protein